MQQRFVVQRTIPYGEVKLVLARDARERLFVGMWLDDVEPGRFVFIQIDSLTGAELARGAVGLYSVITERSMGLVFEAGLDAIDVGPLHVETAVQRDEAVTAAPVAGT